ncbi:hypothetical protein CAP35_15515 [Chitinophagaceae bacterium IBVUCB1]|nr:hypothetical protein CAP35_15515 [Chitinophagaceae bacterium IBVUCB1]
MFSRLTAIIVLTVLIAGLQACCKKRVVCSDEALQVVFTGFDRSTIRTIVLKRYMRGDKVRSKAIDSVQLVNNKPLTVSAKPDTSFLSDYTITTAGPTGIRYGNDWALQFTSNGQTYIIADIFNGDNRDTKVPCRDGDTKCTNNIKSYSIDGFWVESNRLFVRK